MRILKPRAAENVFTLIDFTDHWFETNSVGAAVKVIICFSVLFLN